MDRRIRRLMASVFALVAVFSVSMMDVKGEVPDSEFVCQGDVGDWCPDLDRCPDEPDGIQCLMIMCQQLYGSNFEAVGCDDPHYPECGLDWAIECSDEIH